MFITKLKSQNGFTLLDIAVGSFFLSFVFVGTLIAINNIQINLNQRDVRIRATSLANSMMAIIRSTDFDQNLPGGSGLPTGGLGQESIGDFNDVDDFIGNSSTFADFGIADNGFTTDVDVYYVDPPDLITQVTGTGIWTKYKRLSISVGHSEMASPVTLISIIIPNG